MRPGQLAQKHALREAMAARRRAVPREVACAAGAAAADRLLSAPEVLGAARVALYAALSDEIPTRPLFESLGRAGVARLLPRVGAAGVLEFAEVMSWRDLRPGRYGVDEPPSDSLPSRLGRGDVVVVPGVAFDASGGRLGRGGGYYDRTFPPDLEDVPTLVGLGYEFQMVERVPRGPRDREMDAVATERRIHRVGGEGRRP